MNFTLLFDGQCVICRSLIDEFVTPHKPEALTIKASQEASSIEYPEKELERATREIVLVDEEKKEFYGGYKAIEKLLGLTKQLPWLKAILGIGLLAPFYHFGYNLVAWHRYSWIIVPPYLRCVECGIKIPKLWNFIFFFLFFTLLLGFSFANIFLWVSSLAAATSELFKIIGVSVFAISFLVLLFSSLVHISSSAAAFVLYKKVIGVNKVEVIKQNLIVNAVASACVCLGLYFVAQVSPTVADTLTSISSLGNFNPNSLQLLLSTVIFILGLCLGQLFTFLRWKEIGFSAVWGLLVLFLDSILKVSVPFLVLYFV